MCIITYSLNDIFLSVLAMPPPRTKDHLCWSMLSKKLPNQTIVVALGQPDKSDRLLHVAKTTCTSEVGPETPELELLQVPTLGNYLSCCQMVS